MNLSRSITGALALAVSLLASLPATAEMTLDPGTSVTFHHHDLLGSPVMVSDHKGRVLWYENTKPYGEGLGKKSSSGLGHLDNTVSEATSSLGYTGHTVDSSTGLVYMKARHYDPVIGRFYSNDPIGALTHLNTLNGLQGFNRYTYANNNPYVNIDPNGEATAAAAGITGTILCGPVCGAIAFIGTAAGTGYVLSEMTSDEPTEDGQSDSSDSDRSQSNDTITVEDLIDKSTQRKQKKKKGHRQFETPGGLDEANSDFDNLAGLDNVKPIDTTWGPGRTGTLPNGDTAVVRPGSSGEDDGSPTIDIQSQDRKKSDKFRYGD